MYERISVNSGLHIDEYRAVRNYGANMVKLYGKDNSMFVEVHSKLRACENLIVVKDLSLI